ncbi:hypothetical protein CAEBREN_24100 [Caenorhabditis brenneri]|uniref:Uncharacterized protein n=1 Tax=Caenorhabditis brenneri TaxID=135651 RepID=G0NVJ5_CAEBE|nr:hypothetical protein CAEBREN_24100 [Caenorhabditis brenneri]
MKKGDSKYKEHFDKVGDKGVCNFDDIHWKEGSTKDVKNTRSLSERYKAVTVSIMLPVEAPVPTQDQHNRVQMEVEFQSKCLERFDYFWDKLVGKVEVDPAIGKTPKAIRHVELSYSAQYSS